ncbi:TetR/AcrR family transcriptional regulator, partial [Actinomadura sp. LOL_016]|uniref:TetR/AcrR family transcriptional regulator n=1 Tax=Actinomadura sp. LOL_016 TaxID=3345411 RepID=UPI003A89A3DF
MASALAPCRSGDEGDLAFQFPHGQSLPGSPTLPIGGYGALCHNQIAGIAQDLFLEQGFEETSVDDIARAAGISRRT